MKKLLILAGVFVALSYGANLYAEQQKLAVGKAIVTMQFLPADVGEELGVWKKRGLDITISTFAGTAPLLQAFAAGNVDIPLTAGASVAAAVAKGVAIKIIGEITRRPSDMVLVVGKDSGIKTTQDLRGKTIGITGHGAFTDWLLKMLVKQQGWDVQKAVTSVPLGGFRAQMAALKTKQTHGFVFDIAGGIEAEEANLGKILVNFGEIVPEYESAIIAARKELLEKNPETIKQFLEGWYEATRYMLANRDFAIEVAMKRLNMSRSLASRNYEVLKDNWSKDGSLSGKGLEVVRDSLVDLGIEQKPPGIDLFVDFRFVPVK